MKKNNAVCPACGSEDLKRNIVDSKDCVTLGTEFTYKEIYYHCLNCSDEFDIFNESEKNFRDAEQNANKLLAAQAIEYLAEKSISMALFERIFELPTRTLTRWKEGNLSASALSLLRILITYPWIAKVAEKRYNAEIADYELIHAATNTFIKRVTHFPHGVKFEQKQITNDTTCITVMMDITKVAQPSAVYRNITGGR